MKELLFAEVEQRLEEGCDEVELRRIKGAIERASSPEELEQLERELISLLPKEDFPYLEPEGLEEIRVQRPDGPRKLEVRLDEEELQDRTLGAWFGRCIGCMIGKPVEGWPRERIEELLRRHREWPLADYFPEDEELEPKGALRGRVGRALRDDDLDYMVLGLHILENYGLSFTTEDVAREWLDHLPYHGVHTAERAAYRNLVFGLRPPETARFRNPYREWIGAGIRADIYGLVCPGAPELAAGLAYRDAILSHVKNGVYYAMFVASMLSTAFAVDNLEEVVQIGLSEIPKSSRLGEAVRLVLELHDARLSWEEAWEKLSIRYKRYQPTHSIPNAAFVTLGLLWGEGDFTRAVSLSVMCGLDTDCNGATTGSIMGAMIGARGIPCELSEPLHDTLMLGLAGFVEVHISEMARRTLALRRRKR